MLETIHKLIWGQWLIVFIIGTGLFLTFRMRGIQFRYLPYALRLVFTRRDAACEGDISPFQALMTALAATIGMGNIAGVATALVTGGVGALFWMVVASLFGMATLYAEAYLAIHFRHRDRRDEMVGGPMHYLAEGLKNKWLAWIFAGAGAIAALATGNMVQANSIADVLHVHGFADKWIIGVILAFCAGLVLLGGIRKIGKVTGVLVPFMALFYLLGALIIIALRITHLPAAVFQILEAAFTGQAAMGGVLGITVIKAMQMGVSRGLFASEAGLGSSSIAAAAAKTDVPGRQALINMTSGFLSVCVICTLTGLVIGVTGVLGREGLTGVPLTVAAFDSVLPVVGRYIVITGAILFGYSTILGWAYYGEKCCEYLLGERAIPYYRLLYTLVIIPGAFLELNVVWLLADIANAFMAVPNLIGLIGLSGLVARETRHFLQRKIV